MPGFSIQIFLPDGTPTGVRVVTKSHWSGIAIMCSRTEYPSASKREEFHRTGVYVLIGPSEDGTGRTRIYVGEGDTVHTRIQKHDLDKDFWTDLVVFTKTDGSLNKADVRYLEARLIGLAKAAGVATVENGTTPAPPTPTEAHEADLESLLQDMLTILSLLGVSAFDLAATSPPPAAVTKESANLLTFAMGGASGSMRPTKSGYVLLAGSGILAEDKPSLSDTYVALRKKMRDEMRLVPDPANPQFLKLVEDTSFRSPSAAAAVVYGGNVNGRTSWKDADGNTLADREKAAVLSKA